MNQSKEVDVSFWHKPNMTTVLSDVSFGGEADIRPDGRDFRC
jgi:hypothetical protein